MPFFRHPLALAALAACHAAPSLADDAAAAIYNDRLEGAWGALVEAGLRGDSPLTTPGRERAIAVLVHSITRKFSSDLAKSCLLNGPILRAKSFAAI